MRFKTIIAIFIIFCSFQIKGQDRIMSALKLSGNLIEKGEYKNYEEYDLGEYVFFNGIFENNLSFKIKNKKTNEIVYTYVDSISDAMILKPKFFKNDSLNTILILVEQAAEYTWGENVIILKNGKASNPGYLNYAVDIRNGESISDYCIVKSKNEYIELSFKNTPLVYWPEENKKINGEKLKIKIYNEKIETIK